jgi:NAD(P)-dependent dehydrogenase (short-subunit alcohol dehydrogenase family)
MTNKIAIVTGASYGIGQATAIALARDSYDVVITDISVATLENTQSIIQGLGKKAIAFDLDIRDVSQINHVLCEAEKLGTLYLLVNNAGLPSLRKPATEVTQLEWQTILDVNLTGTFFMTQSFGKKLIASGQGGCVLNMGSTHGHVGFQGASTYGIAKAGLIHLAKMLAIEWAPYDIRVNTISPGSTMTGSRASSFSDPVRQHELLSRIPLNRFGKPEEVAAAVVYLASPLASYITGQNLLLDGGLTAA